MEGLVRNTGYSPSWRQVRAGAWGRNLEMRTEAKTTKEPRLLAWFQAHGQLPSCTAQAHLSGYDIPHKELCPHFLVLNEPQCLPPPFSPCFLSQKKQPTWVVKTMTCRWPQPLQRFGRDNLRRVWPFLPCSLWAQDWHYLELCTSLDASSFYGHNLLIALYSTSLKWSCLEGPFHSFPPGTCTDSFTKLSFNLPIPNAFLWPFFLNFSCIFLCIPESQMILNARAITVHLSPWYLATSHNIISI